MAVKTIAQLKADNNNLFTANGAKDITGPEENAFNEDLIDSMVNRIDNISMFTLSDYDPARTYNIGMACMLGNQIYRCISNGATGTFDFAKWFQITGLIIVNYADALDLHNNLQVLSSRFYYISDRQLILRGNTYRQFDSDGHKAMVTPKYDAPILVWESGTSYVVNDVVAYNALVFECSSSVTGTTPPDSDASHWTLLPSGDFPDSYRFWYSPCNYDLVNDEIRSQKDFNDNYVINPTGTTDATNLFRWGDNRIKGTYINGVIVDNLNRNNSHFNRTVTADFSDIIEDVNLDTEFSSVDGWLILDSLKYKGAGIIRLVSTGGSVVAADISDFKLTYDNLIRNFRIIQDSTTVTGQIRFVAGGGGGLLTNDVFFNTGSDNDYAEFWIKDISHINLQNYFVW